MGLHNLQQNYWLSLLVQFYSYYFDCLIFRYFGLSAELDCSYGVLGV